MYHSAVLTGIPDTIERHETIKLKGSLAHTDRIERISLYKSTLKIFDILLVFWEPFKIKLVEYANWNCVMRYYRLLLSTLKARNPECYE